MSILGQGYWECRRMGGTHTRDTGLKYQIFLFKFTWGQSVAWLDFGANCSPLTCRNFPEGVNRVDVWKCDFFDAHHNKISRWFTTVGSKRTPPVVWAEYQFIFWHWILMYWATTLYPGSLFTSKHDRSTSLWWGIIWGAENRIWWKLVFHHIWHPFGWFV